MGCAPTTLRLRDVDNGFIGQKGGEKIQCDEFVEEVQNRARLASSSETVRPIQATLETLAERTAGREAEDLAAQLPQEVGKFPWGVEKTERFSVDDFFDRVAAEENADVPDAVSFRRRSRWENWTTPVSSSRTTMQPCSRRGVRGRWIPRLDALG